MKDETIKLEEPPRNPEQKQKEGTFITFSCNAREYAIPVGNVMEIVALPEVTIVPNMPVYVKGVINLRGRVIPVIDVRLRFELPYQSYNARTSVVIVSAGESSVGLIVDAVNDVIHLSGEELQPAPSIGDGSSRYIMGTSISNDKVRMLLDIQALLEHASRTEINTDTGADIQSLEQMQLPADLENDLTEEESSS